jgi:hypothetical protein
MGARRIGKRNRYLSQNALARARVGVFALNTRPIYRENFFSARHVVIYVTPI